MFVKLIKVLFRLPGLVVLALFVVVFIVYSLAPVYHLSEFKPFTGNQIFNPYQDCDSNHWIKGNFQVQSRAWGGLTAGSRNTNEAIQNVYKQLGYDIVSTSDYMRINRFGEGKPDYIPTYEHGFGIYKHHQVCLGARKTNWLDYPFFQTLHHKQHILNVLSQNNTLVAIAHPDLRDGYLPEDFQYLTNYDLMEAVSNVRLSLQQWDAALSTGHPVFLLANDDAHNVFNPDEVGVVFTMINSPSTRAEMVLEALKKGKAYGVDIFKEDDSDFAEKAEYHKNLPYISSVEMRHDTLFVTTSIPFHDVIFFGQNGEKKAMVWDLSTAWYKFKPEDTYIRTEVTFWESPRIYLNPVFRYSGAVPVNEAIVSVDLLRTWIQRAVALVIAAIVVLVILNIRKKRKRQARVIHRYYYYN